jgi:hypothetical protein
MQQSIHSNIEKGLTDHTYFKILPEQAESLSPLKLQA